MPRPGSIAWHTVEFLKDKRQGASMAEIRAAIAQRRPGVADHSVRAAIYSHMGDAGEKLFQRSGSRRTAIFSLKRRH
jgi:hypothetical protein